jgi:hypothetical protein
MTQNRGRFAEGLSAQAGIVNSVGSNPAAFFSFHKPMLPRYAGGEIK